MFSGVTCACPIFFFSRDLATPESGMRLKLPHKLRSDGGEPQASRAMQVVCIRTGWNHAAARPLATCGGPGSRELRSRWRERGRPQAGTWRLVKQIDEPDTLVAREVRQSSLKPWLEADRSSHSVRPRKLDGCARSFTKWRLDHADRFNLQFL